MEGRLLARQLTWLITLLPLLVQLINSNNAHTYHSELVTSQSIGSLHNKSTFHNDIEGGRKYDPNFNIWGERGGRYRRQEGEETSEAPAGSTKPETEATTSKTEATTAKPEGGGGGKETTAARPEGEGGATTAKPAPRFCSTELFRRLDRCCPTPALINSVDIQRCVRRSRVKRSDKSEFYNLPNLNFLINMMRRAGETRAANRARVGKRGRKGSTNGTGKTPKTPAAPAPVSTTNVNQVCLVDCVFRNLKWVMEDNTINPNIMYMVMATWLPSPWNTLINNAKTECASILQTGATATMYNPSIGVECLKVPTKMMRCIKKTLINSCPTVINSGPKCVEDMKILKECDINLL